MRHAASPSPPAVALPAALPETYLFILSSFLLIPVAAWRLVQHVVSRSMAADRCHPPDSTGYQRRPRCCSEHFNGCETMLTRIGDGEHTLGGMMYVCACMHAVCSSSHPHTTHATSISVLCMPADTETAMKIECLTSSPNFNDTCGVDIATASDNNSAFKCSTSCSDAFSTIIEVCCKLTYMCAVSWASIACVLRGAAHAVVVAQFEFHLEPPSAWCMSAAGQCRLRHGLAERSRTGRRCVSTAFPTVLPYGVHTIPDYSQLVSSGCGISAVSLLHEVECMLTILLRCQATKQSP